MEKPLITIVHQNETLEELHAVLPVLGFRVRAFKSLSDFISSPEKPSFEAIILDQRSAENLIHSTESKRFMTRNKNRPVIVMSESAGTEISGRTSEEYVELPCDLLVLFRFLQDNLPISTRKHLRMKISLPGIYCHGENCSVAEIGSLGTGGAFIKTGWHRLEKNDLIRIGIPLLGMNRELEIEGRVLYHVEPNEENNYQQGVGIRFNRPEKEIVRRVEDYIRHFLQEKVHGNLCSGDPSALNLFPPGIIRSADNERLSLKY